MTEPADLLQHLVTVNRYCSRCLQTRRFLDRPGHLQCQTCDKRLEKVDSLPGVKR